MTSIRPAVPTDIDGLVACSIGLFAEDAGTRDATLSQEWPRLHAASSFRDQFDDTSKLLLVADSEGSAVSAYATNEGAIRFYRRQGFVPRTVLLECEP